MKRILVTGTGPLFEAGVSETGAHALRTWHLVSPLIAAGHEVRLFTLPMPSENPSDQKVAGAESRTHDGFEYTAFLNCDDQYNLSRLNQVARKFQPEAILGINSHPCALASRMDTCAPFWADLNGSVIIEGQARCAVYGNNALLGHYWNTERDALLRADRFSTVSVRQLHLLHGELAAVGRMNRHTFDYTFATHIPNAVNPHFADRPVTADTDSRIPGALTPGDAFLVLWSGGYNSWTDPAALFEGLERAMAARPELHYISTGGAVRGHDERTYETFVRLVNGSPLKERFHLLGWIDAARLRSLYSECDLGLCIDSPNMETMFGARNRTINMAAAGLPVLTTAGAEISAELVGAGVALRCPGSGPEDISRALIAACEDREVIPEIGRKGKDYVLSRFNYEATTKELLAWAAAPSHAPDHAERIRIAAGRAELSNVSPFSISLNPIEEELFAARGIDKGAPTGSRAASLARRVRSRLNRLLSRGPGGGMKRGLSASAPPPVRLVVSGSLAAGDPETQERIESMIQSTCAAELMITDDGMFPDSLHSLCAALLERRAVSGPIHSEVTLRGNEAAHNRLAGDDLAWHKANRTLSLLSQLRGEYVGRFDFSVCTVVSAENPDDLAALHEFLLRNYSVRHRIEIECPRSDIPELSEG